MEEEKKSPKRPRPIETGGAPSSQRPKTEDDADRIREGEKSSLVESEGKESIEGDNKAELNNGEEQNDSTEDSAKWIFVGGGQEAPLKVFDRARSTSASPGLLMSGRHSKSPVGLVTARSPSPFAKQQLGEKCASPMTEVMPDYCASCGCRKAGLPSCPVCGNKHK